MESSKITIGLPVGSLPDAIGWYRIVLGSRRTRQPVPHILEFELNPYVSLQLVQDPQSRPGDSVLRLAVDDLEKERQRLDKAGVDISPITRHEGVIAFLYAQDPYGNRLCLYQPVLH